MFCDYWIPCLKEGHYQIDLPWKDMCPVCQTMEQWQNTIWSYCTEDFLRIQTSVWSIQHLWTAFFENEHAQMVLKTSLEHTVCVAWYLPHHPVVNPNKPDKICVLFNCAKRYNRMFLNSQLLQGLDQTKNLVGFLIRFCKSPLPQWLTSKEWCIRCMSALRIVMPSASYRGQKTILIWIKKIAKCWFIYLVPLCLWLALILA